MIYLSCCPTAKCFIPFLENIQYLLNKNGFETKITFEIIENDDLWFIIWNGISKLPKKSILYNMDPMVDNIFNELKNLTDEYKPLCILNYCYGKTFDKIKSLDIRCDVLLYGYSEYHKKLNLDKTTDVLFFGNIQHRRYEILKRVEELCHNKKYNLKIFNNNLYGEQKHIEICKSKIVISIASFDANLFQTNDLSRSSQILSSNNFLITEYIGDNIVETKMSKYCPHFKTVDELLNYIDFYMQNDNARQEMINLAQNQFPQDFNFEKDLLKAISIINEH